MHKNKKRIQRIKKINKLLTNLNNVKTPDDSYDQEVFELLDEFHMKSMVEDEFDRLYDKYLPIKNSNLYKVKYQ